MPLTPETLTRHELIGLPVRVAAADDSGRVGIAGRVRRETMRMLVVDCDAAVGAASDRTGVRQVPKRGTTFEFALPDGQGDGIAATPSSAGNAPAGTDERAAGSASAGTDGRAAGQMPARTDEAAGRRKGPGSTSELGSDTAGVRPGQSGPFAPDAGATSQRGECEDVVYVTVDGARLLSRPTTRTERAGDTTWH